MTYSDLQAKVSDEANLELQLAAEALNNGSLVIFNSWHNQVQVDGFTLLEYPERFELGLLTAMVYDKLWQKWYLYLKLDLQDLCTREITDHFADNEQRVFHKRV